MALPIKEIVDSQNPNNLQVDIRKEETEKGYKLTPIILTETDDSFDLLIWDTKGQSVDEIFHLKRDKNGYLVSENVVDPKPSSIEFSKSESLANIMIANRKKVDQGGISIFKQVLLDAPEMDYEDGAYCRVIPLNEIRFEVLGKGFKPKEVVQIRFQPFCAERKALYPEATQKFLANENGEFQQELIAAPMHGEKKDFCTVKVIRENVTQIFDCRVVWGQK